MSLPNPQVEASLLSYRNLLETGLLETEVAVISPYNGQVRTVS